MFLSCHQLLFFPVDNAKVDQGNEVGWTRKERIKDRL